MKLDVAIKDLQTEKTRLEGQLKSVSVAIGLLTKLNSKADNTTAEPAAKVSATVVPAQDASAAKPSSPTFTGSKSTGV